MTVFKCKMCGGELELTADENICECTYCGTKQTVPTADNDKKITLFDRANRLRMKSEFDKAASVYESIVTEFPEEAEAYWGLCLCKYGIEYVDDSGTGKKVPTCHRTSFEGIFKDTNFELAQEYSDGITRSMYREEAKEIDRLQKAILEIAQKEEPFDIFICYKETDENGGRTKDSVRAQEIYNELTKEGYKVFFSRITLEDKLGEAYEPYIFSALNSSKIMLAIGTSYDNYNAVWVKNEWSRFLQMMKEDPSKKLIPCYSDIDAYDMPEEFSNLQGQDMAKIGFLQDLLRGIGKILRPAGSNPETKQTQSTLGNSGDTVAPLLKRVFMFLEDEDFKAADEYCERVLDLDPENPKAYLGKLMVELKVRKQEDLKNCAEPFDERNSYQKAIRFADEKLAEKLAEDNQFIRERNETAWKEDIYRQGCSYMHKNTEEAYKEAIKQFQSIPTYKDSEEKVVICRQKIQGMKAEAETKRIEAEKKAEAERIEAEKKAETERIEAEKKAEAVIAALEKHLNQKKGGSVQDQLKNQEKKLAGLKQLQAFLPEFLKEKAVNEQAICAVKKKIGELQRKRQTLGLLARKEKTAIDAQLQQFNEEQSKLMKTNAEIEKQIAGWSSVSQIEKEINLCEGQINQLKTNLQKVESNLEISYEDALEYVKSLAVRTAVRKKRPELSTLPYLLEVGKEIEFGNYHGKIEWKVLERTENKLLLLSKYGIDVVPYNEENVGITWEKCTLRHWLNEVFLKAAFNTEEQMQIILTNVNADKNPRCYTIPGNDTIDKVFLLSIPEVNRYLESDEMRKCEPTDYAKTNGAFVSDDYKTAAGKDTCNWWLRTPGNVSNFAAYVFYDGSVLSDGRSVRYDNLCIRPALWMNLESL